MSGKAEIRMRLRLDLEQNAAMEGRSDDGGMEESSTSNGVTGTIFGGSCHSIGFHSFGGWADSLLLLLQWHRDGILNLLNYTC